jgi:hypothetical protein
MIKKHDNICGVLIYVIDELTTNKTLRAATILFLNEKSKDDIIKYRNNDSVYWSALVVEDDGSTTINTIDLDYLISESISGTLKMNIIRYVDNEDHTR